MDTFKSVWNTFKLVVDKMFTLVVDRRLVFYLITVAGLVFGFPELSENAGELDAQTSEAITLIVQGAGALFGMVSLLISYAVREPSGLREHPALKKLRELGIDL